MLGHVADDERVAQVRLVRPIFQHRFPVSDAREGIWRHGLALAELLKYAMKHRLDSIEDVILRDEAHFEIKLVEFARRTIGTGVFVTKARRDLEIAIEASKHKELHEHLRRLRPRGEFPRTPAAGHHIDPRSDGRRV